MGTTFYRQKSNFHTYYSCEYNFLQTEVKLSHIVFLWVQLSIDRSQTFTHSILVSTTFYRQKSNFHTYSSCEYNFLQTEVKLSHILFLWVQLSTDRSQTFTHSILVSTTFYRQKSNFHTYYSCEYNFLQTEVKLSHIVFLWVQLSTDRSQTFTHIILVSTTFYRQKSNFHT